MEIKELVLPHELSKPYTSISDYGILLYGREKIGKTTFAAQFPDALFLMFEPGGKALSLYKIDINSWSDFLQTMNLLKKEKRFKTIIIDTVDICYKMCFDYVCKKLGVDHPSEEGWSKAWNMIKDEFQKQISILLKLNRGVLFISHATEKEIKKRYGESEHRIIPTMSKQARDVLEPMIDIWMYCEYGEQERQFIIRGDQLVSAGHRLQNNFVNIDKISMGNSSKESYNNFIDAFNNIEKRKKLTNEKNEVKIKIRR